MGHPPNFIRPHWLFFFFVLCLLPPTLIVWGETLPSQFYLWLGFLLTYSGIAAGWGGFFHRELRKPALRLPALVFACGSLLAGFSLMLKSMSYPSANLVDWLGILGAALCFIAMWVLNRRVTRTKGNRTIEN